MVTRTPEGDSANWVNVKPHPNATLPPTEIWAAVEKFAAWLQSVGYETYDPYDIWGTPYGKLSRRLYYEKHPLGVALTAPLILMEIVSPRLRAVFVRKNRYPTADAQLALAFLNLYAASLNRQRDRRDGRPSAWLTKATTLADALLGSSVPGYSGFCWGYPFDWQNVYGLMPKHTPHITATPYCYEVFAKLFDLTGNEHYLNVARSIAEFVCEDLNDTPTGNDAAAASYTPHDCTKVVNASAYRAFVLFDAARRFHKETFRTKAWKNVRFTLQHQHADGFWLYAIDNPAEAFIDHFHTCFVLKNLQKLNHHLHSADVHRAILRGYEWYRNAMFNKEDDPKSFARAPRLQIVRLEMYNMAEAISLGVLLKNDIPEAFSLAQRLATRLIRRYQLPTGYWVTRVYFGGVKHTLPFLRWPQSQLFLALTSLLDAKDGKPLC